MKPPPHARPVPTLPGYYVTRTGEVYNHRGRLLAQSRNAAGSRTVNVRTDRYQGSATVARLVGEVYCPDYHPDLRAAYRNGKREDCRASNLKWVSVSEAGGVPYSKNPKPVSRTTP